MRVSIIVCTRDRARSLARTLGAFDRLNVPDGVTWEVVVVDNGGDEDTRDVVRTASASLPVVCVGQPLAGLSNARNAGVAAASGDLYLFTDDDVVVDPDWLFAYVTAAMVAPGASIFGGPARPQFERAETGLFAAAAAHLNDLVALRDFGQDARALTHDDIPYGLNYAVRAWAHRGHVYDPSLGVAPGRRRGGEEVAVLRAILAEGGDGVWVPDAKVTHIIPAERQTEAYILQFYTANGEQYPIRLNGVASTSLGLAIGLGLRRMRYLVNRALGRPNWVENLVAYARFKGTVTAMGKLDV